jgi:ketosteroid isomerase-like protein
VRTAALVLGSALAAASATAAPRNVQTPTRTAVQFGGYERELAGAVQHHDTAALDRLLAEDFELRGNVTPGEPVPREDWQEAVLATPPQSFTVSDVSVHTAGPDTAVVSFLYEQQAAAPAPSGRFAFVDVWRRQAGRWRLAVRFAAPTTSVPLPGLVAPEPEIKKKY